MFENDNPDSDNITSTIKATKLYHPVVILSGKDNQKGFERSVYWNEYKTKSENENTTNEYRYFLELNYIGVNRLFALVYSNQDDNIGDIFEC